MLKLILYRWFNASISRKKINSDYFTRNLIAFVNSKNKWKKRYAYIKFVYCSDKYMEIFGAKQYSELASDLFKMLDMEEDKSRKKISEEMEKFYKET